MGTRISWGFVAACASTAMLASACGSVGESAEEQVAEVQQRNVSPAPQEHDTLAVYAARCDAATGIHVPAFSCNEGLPNPSGDHFAWIDQKSSIDSVWNETGLTSVGTATGDRTPDVPEVTAKRLVSTGANISGTSDNFRFAYVPMGNAFNVIGEAFGGQAEVKIVGYDSSSTGAMAGLMVRTTDQANPGFDPSPLNADAPHAMLGISPAGNVHFRYRTARGGTTTTPPVLLAEGFPIWLRLSWELGLGVKAEISHTHEPDSWETVGLAPVLPPPMTAPQVHVGVAVAAATVNYDNFFTTKHCDAPSALGGSCDLKSSFQVLARTADAIAVANCRNQGHVTDDMYGDIAVLQYNRKNGALCFYQSPAADGSAVSAPSDPAGSFPWYEPQVTHQGNCTGCHDTGGLIRSPYLKQTGLLPDWGEGYNNDGGNPLTYVGHDFQHDRSYWVSAQSADNDTGGNCGGCHLMGVNNVNSNGGTSMRFGFQATHELQDVDGEDFEPHKNPPSATSPLWMRPSSLGPDRTYPAAYDPLAAATASNYRQCASFLSGENWEVDPNQWIGQPPDLNCSFGPLGVPYTSPIQILSDLTWGNGGSSSGTSLDNVSVTSGIQTDIYGTSDTGVLAHTLVAPGDGTAMVKVTYLKNTNAYAKAGLMFRAGTAANAANVMIALTAQNGATFQYRPTAGAATPAPAYLGNVTFPLWLRLDRAGESFVGLISTDDRATWQQVGQAVTLPGFSGSQVGLVNTAHSQATQTGQADFEAFDFTHGFGWAGPSDPHLLVDAKVGSATGSRTEWITREYIKASGGDIYGNADDFWYAFKSFDGNGELITTVESLTSTAQWGKAGLMMRDNAIDTAKNVFVGKTPSGVTFQYRNSTGGSTTVSNVTTPNQPTSFRLVRSGLTFTASYRAQGSSTWLPLGSHTFSSFNAKALTGLAVSSQTSGGETNAVFFSGRKVEPPGFLWPDLQPDPDPDPGPGGSPCAGLCTGATQFTWMNNYQSGQLGTGAVCLETSHPVAGGNCSNVFSGRQFLLNDTAQTCNGQNWSSVPPPRNGGYCVELTPGERWDAAFTVW